MLGDKERTLLDADSILKEPTDAGQQKTPQNDGRYERADLSHQLPASTHGKKKVNWR